MVDRYIKMGSATVITRKAVDTVSIVTEERSDYLVLVDAILIQSIP